MKSILTFFALILLNVTSYAQEEIQNGYRCSTTQVYTWPVVPPAGQALTHTARVTIEAYEIDVVLAAQAVWKTCNRVLGQQFKEDWQGLGFKSAPFPTDEFGNPRPPKICVTRFQDAALYSCHAVTRPKDPGAETILVIESTVLK